MFVSFSLVLKSHTLAYIGTVLHTSRCRINKTQLQLFSVFWWMLTTALTHNSLSWQFFALVYTGKSEEMDFFH